MSTWKDNQKLTQQERKRPTILSGQLEFKNVSFHYPTRPDSVILKVYRSTSVEHRYLNYYNTGVRFSIQKIPSFMSVTAWSISYLQLPEALKDEIYAIHYGLLNVSAEA